MEGRGKGSKQKLRPKPDLKGCLTFIRPEEN
jgi:hypothetical protein